ncbi:hypothetical protein HWV62_16756 [Athelia sp. TMB]|nr:hypothetical protein HWV62_16756 [Athelia sp. TMB]
MTTKAKRTRADSSEPDGSGPSKKVPRSDAVGTSGGHVTMGSTFNAIGTLGTVTMVAGHFINGDYNVVQGARDLQDEVKGIQDEQKSLSLLHLETGTFLLTRLPERSINKWMAAPDTSLSYKAAREKHQKGTGSWLVDGFKFKTWKDCSDSVLWLRGGRYVSSSAIEEVKNSYKGKPSAGYAYFFFDGTSARSQLVNHESLVRSIIMQLCDRFDGIPPALANLYASEDNGRSQPLLASLENTLLQTIRSFDNAYIVIDALDECDERPKVLKWIQSITSQTSGCLHLLVASRPEPDIKDRLRLLSNLHEIDVADRQVSGDIRHYIDACLSEVNDWTEAQKELVRIALVKGADGV